MKQKYSPNDIESIDNDWGLDVNDIEQRPYSGRAVQKFIKDTFGKKMGYFYYDVTNNRYLAFASSKEKDTYLEDTTHTELILGTFDAPFNFTASITLISNANNTIFKGVTGNYIEYTFDVVDKSGASTMEGVNVVYTFINKGLKKTASASYVAGTKVSFNVDDYLGTGETIIQIAITGKDTLAATTRSVSYRVLDLSLTSDYNIGKVNNVLQDSFIQVPYTLTSSTHVALYASVDNSSYSSIMETDTYVTNGTYQLDATNLSEGKHSIKLRAQVRIDGEPYYSDIVYKEFIVSRGTINRDLVLFEGIIPIAYQDEEQFKLYGAKRYLPYNFTIAAYSSKSSSSTVSLRFANANQTQNLGSKLLQNGSSETITFTPLSAGTGNIQVTIDDITESVNINVAQSSISIEEITNQLELALSAQGRSNQDTDKASWQYGKYTTTFTNFRWNNRSGWVNNELKINTGQSIDINIAPLSFKPTQYGFTFEIEFSTELVNDENAVILDLTHGEKGLKITASEASLTSNTGRTVSTKFRAGENNRIAFVVDNAAVGNSKLSYIYVNGIRTGAVDFISTDNYDVEKQITIGNTDNAIINIRDIRVYRRALSDTEILNNYILYRSSAEEMLSIYNRNDIIVDGQVSWEQLANYLPVMIVTGNIPILENTTNKKETIYVNVRYENRQDPERSFTMENAVMTPQGTSSMYYPKKNFRLYTKKNKDTVLRVGSSEFGVGRIVENKLYSFKEKAQPVKTWCFKADYAESSSTHNTGVARLWNDALANMQVDGKYVGRTLAQQAAIDNNYDYDVRTTVDGFPVVIFYHLTEDDPLIFLGKYNFNNDKSTESVFGFKDIPGFDNSRMQCWEQLDSGNAYGLFNGDPAGFDNNWADAFEGRYPDESEDTTDLKAFYTWVYSCRNDQEKFNREWKDHIDPHKMAAYYVYLIRFGGVDQVAKNAMLTSEDGIHWFFINYDNDTVLGLDNDGLLKYYWDIDRQTKIEGTDVYCYAAHDSVLWNLLEGCTEFMELVPVVDQALYNARKGTEDVGISYNNVIKMFNTKQAGQWCERVYNEDSNYKYINPFKNNSINHLGKLQGSRSAHRAWWIQNRWNLFDGKWMTGDFRKDGITFKCQAGAAGTTLNITSGNEMYYGIKVQTKVIESRNLPVGQSADFAIDRELQIGTPVSICNPSNVRGLNISNFAENLAALDMAKVQNDYGESQLKDLILGKQGTINNFLNTISGIENAISLQKIDITGFKQLTSLNVSNAFDLREVNALNSGLIDIHLPEGAPVNKLYLPSTLRSLNLIGLSELTTSNLRLESFDNLSSIKIWDSPKMSSDFAFIMQWFSSKTAGNSDCSVEINRISWVNVNAQELINLGSIKTDSGKLDLRGKISLKSANEEIANKLKNIFGEGVFTGGGDLWIAAPDSLFITGPDSIIEGDSVQYGAIVFSQSTGTVTYSLQGTPSTWNATIDRNTGLLTTEETGKSGKLTIVARFDGEDGTILKELKEITIAKAVYPANATITGDTALSGTKVYTWTTTTTGVNRYGIVVWSLSDELTPYAVITQQDTKQCTVTVTDEKALANGNINLSISHKDVVVTASLAVSIINQDVIMTSFSNPEVLKILFDYGLAANENYMTKNEASVVTNEELKKSDGRGIFRQTNIVHFDEFKYFTKVTELPRDLFAECTKFKRIELPNNLTTIGVGAFYNARIEELILPKSVTVLGGSAFGVCQNLKKIELPEGIKAFPSHLFRDCYNLTTVKIPNSVTDIYTNAFYNCVSLLEMFIPENVKYIENNVFQSCRSLKSLSVAETNLIYDSRNNCNAVIRKKDDALIAGIKTSVIPDGIKRLAYQAFAVMPIESITIPASVTNIDSWCFSSCKKLSEIKIKAPTAPSLGNYVFGQKSNDFTGRNTYKDGVNKLYVPAGATGYDSGQWLDPLCNADKCGFTISYTL